MVNISKFRLQLVKESASRYELNKQVTGPRDLYHMFEQVFELSTQAEEVFCMICFDVKLKSIGCFEVSRGSLDASIVTPREVLKRALLCNAYSIAVAHNHPSGDTTPSKEDVNITKRIADASKIIGINLIDHVILGDNDYTSLKDEGYL